MIFEFGLRTRLNAIVDADVATRHGWKVVDLAAAYWDGGARFLQIRAKQASSRDLLAVVESVLHALDARGASVLRPSEAPPHDANHTLIIVNDRADIARIADASGVHVGQEDLLPSDVRRVVAPGAIVGFSTHTAEQIDASASEPVDYVAVGPVFGTATKNTGYAAVGLDIVGRGARGAHPIVAIGGITLENCAAVIAGGAASVAVISDLLVGNDPERRARAFVDILSRV